MNIEEILLMSFESLRDRKVRSVMTIFMVVVGSTMMVALNGLTAGIGTFIDAQFSNLATNVLVLSTTLTQQGGVGEIGGSTPSTPKIIFNSVVLDKIRSLPNVTDVVATYQGQITLQSRGQSRDVSALSIDPTKLSLIAPTLEYEDGSSLLTDDPTAMIVSDSIANPAGEPIPFLVIGQTVRATYSFVDPNTGNEKDESRSFIVQGIMKSTGNPIIDRAVIINLATGNSLLHKSLRFDSLMVVTPSADEVSSVQQEITDLYKNDVGISTPQAILKTEEQFTNGFSSFILAIASVALVVGAIGIITTLYTSVIERVREIGTMKAVGAQNKDILFLFLSEASMIGIIGATIGIFLGIGVGYILTIGFSTGGTLSITPTFLASNIVFVWVLSVCVSIVAGIYPAWKASRLSPITALSRD